MGRFLFRTILPGLGVALLFAFPLASLFEAQYDNITVPFAVLLALAGGTAFMVMAEEDRLPMIVACAGAVLFYGFARWMAPNHSILDKLEQFAMVLGLFGIATALAMSRPNVIRHFGTGMILLGGIATALLLLSPGEYQAGRLSFGDNNPIWMARLVGYLGLGAIGLYLHDNRTFPLVAILFLASVVGIVMTASRGPLLGLLLSGAFAAVFFSHARKEVVLFFGALGTVFVVLAAMEMGLIGAELFTLGSREDSADVRTNMLLYTIDLIKQAPEGVGVGWFMYAWQPYPHNLWLEFFVEWGWVVGFAFLALTGLAGLGLMRLPEKYNLLKLLFIYEVVNAGLSGDISSPRFLYALLILGNARLIYGLLHSRRPAPVRVGPVMPWERA